MAKKPWAVSTRPPLWTRHRLTSVSSRPFVGDEVQVNISIEAMKLISFLLIEKNEKAPRAGPRVFAFMGAGPYGPRRC